MVSLTGQIFGTGHSRELIKKGKLEVFPYIMVRILGPVTILGLTDRSEL